MDIGRRAALALLISLGGCTSLETRPTYAVSKPDRALPDHGYRLPMLQYEIIVGYKLASCPGSVNADGKPSVLAFKVETAAAADHVAGEGYTIDYSALTSLLKVTDFAIEAHPRTGTLKAINASAEDKTGDAIKSAVELGISVASLAAGNPLPMLGFAQSEDDGAGKAADKLLAAAEMTHSLSCTPTAIKALADAEAARAEIKRLNGILAPDIKRVEAITIRASVKLSDERDAKALVALHDRQLETLERLGTEQDALQRLDKSLTFVDVRTWPADPWTKEGGLGVSAPLATWMRERVQLTPVAAPTGIYDPAMLEAAFRVQVDANAWKDEVKKTIRGMLDAALARQRATAVDGLCPRQTLEKCLEGRIDVHAELQTEGGQPVACKGLPKDYLAACVTDAGISARSNTPHKGVFFRQPIRAKLLLCDRGRTCRDGDRDALLRTGWDVAPQLGQLRFAGLTNGAFQNNALSLTIREDGTLVKFQYSEKSAILAQALATAATVATKVDEERVARDKERRQALLDRRADIAYERTETAAVRGEAAAVRTDELANLQYQFDKVAKEKALLEQRFPPATTDPVVVTEFANETTRLEAMATQLRWRIAIREAEEKLAK